MLWALQDVGEETCNVVDRNTIEVSRCFLAEHGIEISARRKRSTIFLKLINLVLTGVAVVKGWFVLQCHKHLKTRSLVANIQCLSCYLK